MLQARFLVGAVLTALGLFTAMLVFLEIGRRIGLNRLEKPGSRAGVGVVDGTVYALLALLIGFSFNGAAARFDNRRMLIGQEVNAASTAWLRIDALPADRQPEIRAGLKGYVDALIATYKNPPTDRAVVRQGATLQQAQATLWGKALAICITPEGEKARMLLLPSLNELFDAVDSEHFARGIHPPMTIFVMLALTALAGALFVGYALATGPTRNWIYTIGVAATIASAAYVIFELEYPRLGLIRIDNADQALVDFRATLD